MLAALNGRTIISLFTDDADIITQVAQLFLISLILEPGRTFNLVVINALRATWGRPFPALHGARLHVGIAVPLAYFLGIMQGYGLVGIWLALACDEWVRGLAMFCAGAVVAGKTKFLLKHKRNHNEEDRTLVGGHPAQPARHGATAPPPQGTGGPDLVRGPIAIDETSEAQKR